MSQEMFSVVVFAAVIVVIISEKLHRAVAAAAGAVLLILTKVLSLESSVSYIDFNTIGVLVGMMLFIAVVKNSGIFEYIAVKSAKIAKGVPWKIMVFYIIITAVFSAFLDNVTTVLLIGPMTIAITRILKIDPVPFLITQIIASNIGGTATLIGDPPNIMIGSTAGLSFLDFLFNNGPVVVIILAASVLYFLILYKKQLVVDPQSAAAVLELDEQKTIKDRPLLIKSIVMIILVAVGFTIHDSLHLESSVIALTAASIMLIIGGQNAEEIIADVEWPTIVFFISLFIVVGGMAESGAIDRLAGFLMHLTQGNTLVTMLVILWASALLSAVLDNIPFVAALLPMIVSMGNSGMDVAPLWWAVSLGACLGGNGTLIGASANVVLSGISGRNGHPITFLHYLKVGFPLMIISIVISTAYMLVRYS
ncbi:ArsB/NhaD family transporter [Anaerovorax odorimutans]|uniref:ArsB/NhaD family transporter n=1 Tax=Anaerovorax odorimutans TaxID=109327 RepID=A0ABT1RP61_9FIRM|nr:ArsB/NhaD family transporter [Anaerovorax odorimutans]MCQ4636960.1 ArsB/NhaD family transporter [Anaerovorax odorimutans]